MLESHVSSMANGIAPGRARMSPNKTVNPAPVFLLVQWYEVIHDEWQRGIRTR